MRQSGQVVGHGKRVDQDAYDACRREAGEFGVASAEERLSYCRLKWTSGGRVENGVTGRMEWMEQSDLEGGWRDCGLC